MTPPLCAAPSSGPTAFSPPLPSPDNAEHRDIRPDESDITGMDWVLIGAVVLAVWAALGMFATERQVGVMVLQIEAEREKEAARIAEEHRARRGR